jgi:hypothetical protein
MKVLVLIPLVLLVGCAAVEPLGKGGGDRFVALLADTDPAATRCGGLFNDVRLPDTTLQANPPRCKVMVEAKNGSNTWVACNSNTSGEACAAPFTFNIKGSKP